MYAHCRLKQDDNVIHCADYWVRFNRRDGLGPRTGGVYKDAERIKAGDPEAIMKLGQQQNRMMTQRVLFQGIAVVLVALLGALASR